MYLHWLELTSPHILCSSGLSPDLQSMVQIRRVMRPTDVPDQGLLCDLLWSDPDKDVLGWGENDRGVSFTFGSEVVAKFLHKHDLDLICRAHQVLSICLNPNVVSEMRSSEGVRYFNRLSKIIYSTNFSLFHHNVRLLRMAMSSLLRDSWWHYSPHPTTAGNLTTLEPWWAWMRLSCVHFRCGFDHFLT